MIDCFAEKRNAYDLLLNTLTIKLIDKAAL